MNAPAAIRVTNGSDYDLWLHTAWFGIELPQIVAEALSSAYKYLDLIEWAPSKVAYILFAHLTKGQDRPLAGFWIDLVWVASEAPVITVNVADHTVQIGDDVYSVADYIANERAWRDAAAEQTPETPEATTASEASQEDIPA